MNARDLLPVLVVIMLFTLVGGCTQQAPNNTTGVSQPEITVTHTKTPDIGTTPADLTTLVKRAVTYARENGRGKALAEFNDPNGSFVEGEVYVFAEAYDGTALAEPFHHELVGTNIRNMTDRFGVPLVRHIQETARYGIGFVSYDYPNPDNNNMVRPKLSVVSDVDGTYYVGAGTYDGAGMVYPSTGIGPATRKYTIADLTTFVKNSGKYARENGKDKAISAFNDPKGQFADGELTIMAVDYNGTVLASSLTPDNGKYTIDQLP
jgi:hypothetical protein